MGAGLGILFFGIIQGIVIGVVLSLLLLIGRASNPGVRVLGRKPGSEAYLDVARNSDAEQVQGVIAVRIDGPLFFADANRFRDRVRELVAATGSVDAVVIDAESVSQTDTDGADILIEIAAELHSSGAALGLARVQSEIADLWRRAGVFDAIGEDRSFSTTAEAVEAMRPR
jgi:anti-anti-sigma factor